MQAAPALTFAALLQSIMQPSAAPNNTYMFMLLSSAYWKVSLIIWVDTLV